MQYRKDRYGNPISQLGLGCMRFTRKGAAIDYEKAERELLLALDRGITYYDTAYIYPGSEELLGRFMAEHGCRSRMQIATKLPQYLMRSLPAVEKTFREELKRLRTDYIDYYLMHMFTDISEWDKLKALGLEDWIAEKKACGAIRQIGFSYHGDTGMFLRLLDAYDWDFCQIQYNYLDEHSQAGREGLQAAAARGLPVIIMEPLRGGKLVNLPDKARKLLAEDGCGYTPAELGLRWLWNQPEVTCVLSGMNSEAMIEENTRLADVAEAGHWDAGQTNLIENVCAIIREREKVGCTGCRYCQPCPAGVDIPTIFHYYNLMYMEKKASGRFGYAQVAGMKKDPGYATRCIGCGKCEQHCPQHLDIRAKLKEADKALRPLPYRVSLAFCRKIMLH